MPVCSIRPVEASQRLFSTVSSLLEPSFITTYKRHRQPPQNARREPIMNFSGGGFATLVETKLESPRNANTHSARRRPTNNTSLEFRSHRSRSTPSSIVPRLHRAVCGFRTGLWDGRTQNRSFLKRGFLTSSFVTHPDYRRDRARTVQSSEFGRQNTSSTVTIITSDS